MILFGSCAGACVELHIRNRQANSRSSRAPVVRPSGAARVMRQVGTHARSLFFHIPVVAGAGWTRNEIHPGQEATGPFDLISKQQRGRCARAQHSWTEAPTNSLTRLSIARHTAGCFPVRADNGPIRGDEWSTCPLSVPLFHTNNTREYVQAAVEAGSHRFSLLYKPTISPGRDTRRRQWPVPLRVFITNVSGQRVGRPAPPPAPRRKARPEETLR